MIDEPVVAILDQVCNVEETEQPFGKRWRHETIRLTREHLQALQDGRFVAIDVQAEYVVFLELKGGEGGNG